MIRTSETAVLALIAAALGDEYPRSVRVGLSKAFVPHKEGEPGSRMESRRDHHKAVRRKKRARKNKRGY
jgi:hypothetical protein